MLFRILYYLYPQSFSVGVPILGDSDRVFFTVPTEVAEPSAPKEDSAPADEMVFITDPLAPSSNVDVAGPSVPIPRFLIQRVHVSTILSM